MTEGDLMVAEARKWLGVRWRHQGRSRRTGVDCVGLCLMVARGLGVTVADITTYPRRHDGSLLRLYLDQRLTATGRYQPQQGDVALFRDNGFAVHVGFIGAGAAGALTVIHAHARRRQVIEEDLSTFGVPIALYKLKEAL